MKREVVLLNAYSIFQRWVAEPENIGYGPPFIQVTEHWFRVIVFMGVSAAIPRGISVQRVGG